MSHAARTSADRFGVTLLFSLIVHAVVALGLTFEFAKPAPSLPALDVTLVNAANAEAPDKADFLAQANNRGGGDADRARRPSQTFSSPLPKPDAGIAPRPLSPAAPKRSDAGGPQVLTRARSDYQAPSDPDRRAQPVQAQQRSELTVDRRLEMARLAAEVRQESEALAKRPRKKFISANTREYAYAAYMKAWVTRIERIGNLNYPDEARRRQLHGDLVLTVGLNRDGTIKSMDVIQSSGHKVLDDAAMRIVRLAAPFPPIPHAGDRIDELYITRTWQFLPGDVLRNR
ncbi:TonB family protein [Mizugakiibacter sediminis]|uniref:Energy transducer TonB n=1 Tax=Mizugakiibacter sediminis TaxID=1475481 RepID=A0A0K8QKH2_9GAMM|nr:energy transducer TonB [Mizugakiibacter sediminis]GAP65156.1 TonB family protein [Mizugakiibacter sediminis]